MPSIEKMTITVTKATIITTSIVAFAVNILTVFFTVKMQMQKQSSDLELVFQKLTSEDKLIRQEVQTLADRVGNNKGDIATIFDLIDGRYRSQRRMAR